MYTEKMLDVMFHQSKGFTVSRKTDTGRYEIDDNPQWNWNGDPDAYRLEDGYGISATKDEIRIINAITKDIIFLKDKYTNTIIHALRDSRDVYENVGRMLIYDPDTKAWMNYRLDRKLNIILDGKSLIVTANHEYIG